ncbi:phage virion morphogenesis protein [Photobacterium sp. 1_MG-2023]|uniref:phage virion morphogenesis protein n=1 Tax=Photobacterium sp. 1_MG-2023 TaxID=3062646 RepID=UPI0026E1B2E0|nr:phage virion morphogenesis protein [Photobacterium sp. 1_MG-2023]MDO6706148.1 phage virion morphogenesis protein [Photobacterium sp. 1_MG-2023]
MIEVKADKQSYLRVKESLELLALDKKARQRILRKVGTQIAKTTRKNIRAQRGPDGQQWKQRQRGRGKMLRGFTKKLKHFQRNNSFDLFVGWPSARGSVAYQHHHGLSQSSGLTARKRQAKKQKEPKPDDPATREQAKALRDLDYRFEPQGRQKRGKKPTLKWIMDNMKVGEAAKTIQSLENKVPARSWEIGRPERHLIGVSPKRTAMMIKRELKRNRSK